MQCAIREKNNVTENSENGEFLCSCCHLTSDVSTSNSNCRLHAVALNNKDWSGDEIYLAIVNLSLINYRVLLYRTCTYIILPTLILRYIIGLSIRLYTYISELTQSYRTMSNVTRKTSCAKTNDFLVGNIYFCILIIHRNNEASDIIETNVSPC